MSRFTLLLFALASLRALPAPAQTLPGLIPGVPPATAYHLTPENVPPLSPGQVQLMELEARFQEAVRLGGGKAFASFFADDAVTLANGKPAVLGRGAIAVNANWSADDYQLTWLPEGAQMGPSNDTGFTWGRYEGQAKARDGRPIVTTGRFITIWKKMPGGDWKVALDASADAPPAAPSCCTLPPS